ncbi:unnamed protein product [Linum tenue]|uniref:Uncharacterized protein n=1 Tax=Linum tenue TaxID=586396 RepID=A0AAV0LZE3_9ROSI|nr:unnamed protein product [Linum tenue]
MKTFEKIMEYADSHGGVGLHHLSVIDEYLGFNIRDATGVITRFSSSRLFDPFGNLPRLNYLKLIQCIVISNGTCFQISGLELLDLEMQSLSFYGVYEVIAPKLKSFRLWDAGIDPYLPKLKLPALDYADIRLGLKYDNEASEEKIRAFMNLLGSLPNAECLQLRFDKVRTGCSLQGTS